MDEIDDRILGILAVNGRASFATIGEQVGLSPHGAADRVRRLERDAFVDVRLLPSTDSEEFEHRVGVLDSVREMAFVTGRFDFQLRVACRDAEDLNQTIRTIRREAGAAGTETRIVLRSSTLSADPKSNT